MEIKTLKDTTQLMESDNPIDQFKGEYYQLAIRMKDLSELMLQMKEESLDSEPESSYDLFEKQLLGMQRYKHALELRANVEGIELQEV